MNIEYILTITISAGLACHAQQRLVRPPAEDMPKIIEASRKAIAAASPYYYEFTQEHLGLNPKTGMMEKQGSAHEGFAAAGRSGAGFVGLDVVFVNGKKLTRRWILDVGSASRITITDVADVKTTLPMGLGDYAMILGPGQATLDCSSTSTIKVHGIDAIECVRPVRSVTGSGGRYTIKRTSTLVPAMDFAEVAYSETADYDDGRALGRRKKSVLRLVLDKPDSKLFEIPAKATEVVPSILEAEWGRALNGDKDCPQCFVNYLTRIDQVYHNAKSSH